MLDWNKLIERLTRIIKFDHTVWAEIEHDENANMEAGAVVVAAALLWALGSAFGGGGVGGFFLFIVYVVLVWLLWSWVTQMIGTKLFGGEATFWEMARCLGYALAPMALGILVVIPCVGWLVGLAAIVLALVLGFFATREALDLPTDKTIITLVIGGVLMLVIYGILWRVIGS